MTKSGKSNDKRRQVKNGDKHSDTYGFKPYTPNGCPSGSEPIWAIPGTFGGDEGIDACIIRQARENNIRPDTNNKDRERLRQLVERNCGNTDEVIADHRLYCAPELTRELLWDGGGCQYNNGYPNLAKDGNLVCAPCYYPCITNPPPYPCTSCDDG